jgi:putative DNA primase/helicase
MEANRDQLWAEARHRFDAGEPWWDIPDAESEQEQRYQVDSWEDLIQPFLQRHQSVTITDVLEQALGIKPEKHGKSEQIRVGNILRRLKWVRKQDTNGQRKRYYVPAHRKGRTP